MDKIENGMYRHFKGKTYIVLGIAKHTEGDYNLVIYYEPGDNKLYARPELMFKELVLHQGDTVPRFQYIKP